MSGAAPAVAPGQFMMVYAFGIGEVPISVSGPPWRPGSIVLTVRDVGAVTHAVCAAEPGAVLGLRGPLGNSWPVDAASGGDVVVDRGRNRPCAVAPGRAEYPRAPRRLRCRDRALRRAHARRPALRQTGRGVARRLGRRGDCRRGRAGMERSRRRGAEAHRGSCVRAGRNDGVRLRPGDHDALRDPGRCSSVESPADRIIVSMERDMHCGVGLCGHCQLGPTLICRDGPVYTYAEIQPWLEVREL